jgi:hypothetical protein
MKRRIIVPKTVSHHIEEGFRKSPAFRKAYKQEIAKLQKDIRSFRRTEPEE